jgi:hypothetical protein
MRGQPSEPISPELRIVMEEATMTRVLIAAIAGLTLFASMIAVPIVTVVVPKVVCTVVPAVVRTVVPAVVQAVAQENCRPD